MTADWLLFGLFAVAGGVAAGLVLRWAYRQNQGFDDSDL